MASSRLVIRSSRAFLRLSHSTTRPFSLSTTRFAKDNDTNFDEFNKRGNDTVDVHRKGQIDTPLNPHLTNTTSTFANAMPSVGEDAPPPEFLSHVGKDFTPKDSVPENTERMTGGTQGSQNGDVGGSNKELGVGEMEGASFKVEPLRREGEEVGTMRARLLYQSRKRGILETDLLLSTFADANLGQMSSSQLKQYDRFLDENDWDIYYWATQTPPTTSTEYAEGGSSEMATDTAKGKDYPGQDERAREPGTGEWAQTVGTYKPAYRPVPARWRDSEVLSLLRRHVQEKSAGGVSLGGAGVGDAGVGGEGLAQSVKGTGGGGLGRMPDIKTFD